ncbi:MAG TPA: hypothetical protein VJ647_05080, partial [Chitinophagaceae bacterium]|nr:hypothetical protein [Chitinophagaceae bacterium]
NDIAVRLLNAGVQLRFLKFGGVVYHLYHKQAGMQRVAVNEQLFEKSILNKVTYIRSGMQQYAAPAKYQSHAGIKTTETGSRIAE